MRVHSSCGGLRLEISQLNRRLQREADASDDPKATAEQLVAEACATVKIEPVLCIWLNEAHLADEVLEELQSMIDWIKTVRAAGFAREIRIRNML